VNVLELWTGPLGGQKKDYNIGVGKMIRQLIRQVGGWIEIDNSFKDADGKSVRGFKRIKMIL
jgi:hypothetical protein